MKGRLRRPLLLTWCRIAGCAPAQPRLTLRSPTDGSSQGLCPRNFPDQTAGVGCRFSLQGIFLTQWLNPHPLHLPHWQADSLSQHHLGSPGIGKSGDIPPRGLGRGNSSESTDSRHYLLFSPVRSQESNSTLLLLFSLLDMSDSLPPHGLQHARIPCPPSSPRVCSNMSIESVMTFNHLILCRSLLYLLSIFPASGSFPKSQLFSSDGQGIGASASASVLPMNIQDCYPLGLTGLISLLSKGISRVFYSTKV